jgi:hypothetical protein
VAEWSNVLDSKSSVGATLPWVRIPPSPPHNAAERNVPPGEVAEWSNVLDSKSSVGATLPWVRIPPSPPEQIGKAPAREPFLFVRAERSERSSRVGFEDSRVLARGRPALRRRIPPSPPEQIGKAPRKGAFFICAGGEGRAQLARGRTVGQCDVAACASRSAVSSTSAVSCSVSSVCRRWLGAVLSTSANTLTASASSAAS